jgi:hypothetical protein
MSLARGKDGTINLDAPLATSTWHHIGNKTATNTTLEAASTEKIQSWINKCLADVYSHMLIRDQKADERWAALLQKQEEKI